MQIQFLKKFWKMIDTEEVIAYEYRNVTVFIIFLFSVFSFSLRRGVNP
jgi:hypothetical protein